MLKRMELIAGRPTFPDEAGDRSGPAEDLRRALWVDLLDPSTEEETFVERTLGIEVPTQSEMAEIEESARLYADGDVQLMTAVLIEGAGLTRPNRIETTFILTPRHLVTVRYADPTPLKTFPGRVCKQPELNDSPLKVLISLLESIVERAADIMEQSANELNAIGDAIFYDERKPPRRKAGEDPLRTTITRLGQKNRTLSILRESHHSLGRIVSFLRQGRTAGLGEEEAHRLKALDRDIRSIAAFEAQLGQQISFLHEATLGLINIEQNAIIKVFSIAAVLFLPPTLVGTVYGMNFDRMPELAWTFGYPFALGAMVVSAILPYLWFKWRGWL